MLNLGLELPVKEEPVSSYEDVLTSQLEFQEAYQAFVDYKNVCEIVVKAKVSTESMAFANDLLNASVENINVSVENLKESFKNAWNKFVDMWKKFVSWVKDAFKSLYIKVEGITLPVTVTPETDDLWMLSRTFKAVNNVIARREPKAHTVSDMDCVRQLSESLKKSQKLGNIPQVKQWIKSATEFIKEFDYHVKYCTKNIDKFQKDWKELTRTELNYGEKNKIFSPAIAARYLMRFGPPIINHINKTIKMLSNSKIKVKENKGAENA